MLIQIFANDVWSVGRRVAGSKSIAERVTAVKIDTDLAAKIRRLFHVEHWTVGTIATQLDISPARVRGALRTDRFNKERRGQRTRLIEPVLPFIKATLEQYPTLSATRIFDMVRDRGYRGSVIQLRREVRTIRPRPASEAFIRMHLLPGEEAQVDWADFGRVIIGRAERRLSCFVMTLAYSRAMYLEFFFDQQLENFLRGHVRAFIFFGGTPRTIAHDNLRSAVLERFGNEIRLHPRFRELLDCYRLDSRACAPRRGNEKGRVERAIRYVRESFFAGRTFTTLEQLNGEAWKWCAQVAHQRPCPGDRSMSVAQALEQERPALLALPLHPFETDLVRTVITRKTIYIRFDRNDYSIPPSAVGRPLTLCASDILVRILDGSQLVASHRRSFDKDQCLEDPAHRRQLLEHKTAGSASQIPALLIALPAVDPFLRALMKRGESPATARRALVSLFTEYGPELLSPALTEVLARSTPSIEAVRYVLERMRREARRPITTPIDLTDRPELTELHVQPHSLETYDALYHKRSK